MAGIRTSRRQSTLQRFSQMPVADRIDRAAVPMVAGDSDRRQTTNIDTLSAGSPGSHTDTPALAFCTANMRTERKPEGYPSVLNHLADHLKKRILDLGINQKVAGKEIGVGTGSFTHWMRKHRNPTIRRWPKLIQFLGYDPRPAPVGIGPALVKWRQGRGQSQEELAAVLRVDPSTLAKWERGDRVPIGGYLGRVRDVLNQRA